MADGFSHLRGGSDNHTVVQNLEGPDPALGRGLASDVWTDGVSCHQGSVRSAAIGDALSAYSGMDPDAANELKELRQQNTRLKRLLAEAELEKDALREVAKGKF